MDDALQCHVEPPLIFSFNSLRKGLGYDSTAGTKRFLRPEIPQPVGVGFSSHSYSPNHFIHL